MKYLVNLKKALDELGVVYSGCSDAEIDTIIRNHGNILPICYKEFLSAMGKDMDRKHSGKRGFLVGSSAFYDDIKGNNNIDGLNDLLTEDNSKLAIPNNAFVFYGHQGYIYAFFKTNEGDNPPVYGYIEGYEGSEFPRITESLSQFYEDYLEGKNIFANLS